MPRAEIKLLEDEVMIKTFHPAKSYARYLAALKMPSMFGISFILGVFLSLYLNIFDASPVRMMFEAVLIMIISMLIPLQILTFVFKQLIKSQQILITNTRCIIDKGLINYSRNIIGYSQINDVDLQQQWAEKSYKIATIKIRQMGVIIIFEGLNETDAAEVIHLLSERMASSS